jgi:AAA domain
MTMNLASIRRGPRETPFSVVLYGPEGIGKSTFGAGAPNPIFLGTEDGTAQLDVASFPSPQKFQDVLDAIATLATEEHEFRTLVLDTLDWLEPLIHAHVCKHNGKATIEAFGYGKGYVLALDEWRKLLAAVGALRAKGMNVVLLAHSRVKAYHNPAGDDYDRYTMKLHEKAEQLVKEWADAVLFATYKVVTTENDQGRIKAYGDGTRVAYTEHRPAWDAKNRYGLPLEIPLEWSEFERSHSPKSLDSLREKFAELVVTASEEIATKAKRNFDKVSHDAGKLQALINWLTAKLPETAQQ